MPIHAITEDPTDGATQNQTGWPASVQDVQVVGALGWEQRCDQRVSHCFQSTVGESEDEHAPIEQREAGFMRLLWSGHHGDDGGEDMHGESQEHQLAVAEFVANQTTTDDAETKTGETCASDVAKFFRAEAELQSPLGHDAAAHTEADTGRENGEETSPHEATGIGG